MRELKFRAYKEDWPMAHPEDDNVAGADLETIHDFIREKQKDGWNFLQYTGINDSKGEEIYEGDLLGFTDEKNSENKRLFEVFYHQGAGRFDCNRTHYIGNICGTYIPPLNSDHLEVIGNIYENPELIK
jgi:hypothetical protein